MTHDNVTFADASLASADITHPSDARFRAELARGAGAAFRLATVILGNRSDAEEATQDALERAWRARHALRDADRFDPWFQRIVVNMCRDKVRKRRAAPALMSITDVHGSDDRPAADLTDPFASTLAQDAIRRAFVRLNVDQRIVVAMRFYLDLEVDEIARRLGIRHGTVKSRLHRALRTLRESWEGDR